MHCLSACFNRTVSPPLTEPTANSEEYLFSSIRAQSALRCVVRLKAWRRAAVNSSFARWAIFVTILSYAAPCIALAAQVSLAWQPNESSANGYRVYQRLAGESYNYNSPVWTYEGDANNQNSCTIDGLEDDRTYYFVIRACKSDIESSDSNEVEFNASLANSNKKPVASAGANQTVMAESLVYLDGTGSFDVDGDPLAFQFVQTTGPDVGLNCSDASCHFTAPSVTRTTALLFELTVDDGSGLYDSATTVILVTPPQSQPDIGSTPDPDQTESGTQTGNHSPLEPLLTAPIDGGFDINLSPWIRTSSFEDPDEGDNHLLTQWHIIDSTTQKDVLELISTNDFLTDTKLSQLILDPSSHYSVQVRFFDDHGLSSNWSVPAAFTTGDDSTDMNKNKIPDELEVSAHADLNGDGIADIDQPSVIKSISTHNRKYLMGISVENGGNAVSVEAVSNIDPKSLEIFFGSGDKAPFGLLASRIKVSQPGDSAYATVYLSDPIDTKRAHWMRYDSTNGWKDSSGNTVMDTQGFVVERSLKDGGVEDADGVANGVIIDLSGPLYLDDSRASLTSSSDDDQAAAAGGGGGGGGDGCFIKSLF